MGTRRTRDEAMQLEDAAVAYAAHGYTPRQIAAALGLSTSETRRKLRQGYRRRLTASDATAWAALEAQLRELLRTGYEDHRQAPPGAPARVGTLKVITAVVDRIARLHGLDLRGTAGQHGGPGAADAAWAASGRTSPGGIGLPAGREQQQSWTT